MNWYLPGVFALLNAVAFLKYLQRFLTKSEFRNFFILASAVSAGIVFVAVVGLTYAGIIAPWSGRFYSLWDTGKKMLSKEVEVDLNVFKS